jgi:hypothetical protein
VISVLLGCSATVSPSAIATALPARADIQTASPATATTTPTAEMATPSPSVQPETASTSPSPSPGEMMPDLPEVTHFPETNSYTSKWLNLTFTVPESWVGKYSVWEDGSCCLNVYFNPSEYIDDDVYDGMLFSINMKESELDELLFQSLMEFDIDGKTYIFCMPKDESYRKNQSEYGTYMMMQKDIPAIFTTIRTATGQLPENIVYNPKPAPLTLKYSYKRLGITFSMPESWKDKYRVEEGKDNIYVYFKPKKPLTEENGSGFLFAIEKKTKETPVTILDVCSEIKIHGVTYICYGSTSVEYAGEEEDLYLQMASEIYAISETIRAAK